MSKILYTDLLEYPTDELAQASWITDGDSSGGLPSSEYSTDSYTKLLLHCNGVDGSTTFTDDANSLLRSNADIDDEDMADITDWTDADTGNGASSQVTFDSTSCMKLDSGVVAGVAYRWQDIGSMGSYYVVSFRAYFEALGTIANNDVAGVEVENGSIKLIVRFGSDGLRVYDGSNYVLIDADIVVQDEWHEWTFVVDDTDDTVDIYLDGVLKYANVDCSYSYVGTDGKVGFLQYGNTTANRITYIDWFKAGSTTTSYGHIVTANGNAQIDTAQKKFGTASALFDGAGDYLSIPDSNDWNFGTGDFTIAFWLRFNTLPDEDYCSFVSQYQDVDNQWTFQFLEVGGAKTIKLHSRTAGSIKINLSWSVSLVTSTWYHIAITRSGTTIYCFVDGILISGQTEADAMDSNTGALNVGRLGSGGQYLNGWIDELRISKGIARWTENFDTLTYDLQCYSEATIKQQGSYSLKIEANTNALNDTLTKTLIDYLDYSIMDVIKFEVRASRTGSNIKLKIYDVGGTTSEHVINIASADTWQTESWDISAIATGDRDTIEKIIIEISNADVANTIYIDNLFSKAIVESSHVFLGG